MISFERQAGNGKLVTNKIFFTDAGCAQEPQGSEGSEDMAQGGQEGAQEGDKQEVEVEVQHEEEVEGAVGGQELEDKDDEEEDEEEDKEEDKEDDEDEEDDVIDELVTSGHIKMVRASEQAGSQVGNRTSM